jgi:hypothetical protein
MLRIYCDKHTSTKIERKYYGGKYTEFCPECRKNLFCNAFKDYAESISPEIFSNKNLHHTTNQVRH